MSFQQGLSGLNASAKQLDTIGHNVANASTVGFKASQAQFADMYAASLSGGSAVQTGTGVKVAAIAQQFTQGNVTSTNNSLDMAISGSGFFQMIDPSGSIAYTRNGQFQLDKNGFIVSNQGHQLKGYQAVKGVVGEVQGPLQIGSEDLAPKQTVGVNVAANLDSREVAPLNGTFDINDQRSYNKSTSLTVYDSEGVNHIASLYFQRQPVSLAGNVGSIAAGSTSMTITPVTNSVAIGHTITLPDAVTGANVTYTITGITSNAAAGTTTLTVNPPAPAAGAGVPTTNAGSSTWSVYMAVDGALVPATNPATKLADLAFSTNGTLVSATPTAPAAVGLSGTGTVISDPTFTPLGASPLPITFDFNKLSQYGANFGVNALSQDGYSTGRLTGFSTSPDGLIQGRYSNGQSQILGQLALANFTNVQGLQPIGNNEWVETVSSGAPVVGRAGSGRFGALQSSSVEESNVDLTAELVNMITAQRVYQANSQTIKAQDQVLQTIVNLR